MRTAFYSLALVSVLCSPAFSNPGGDVNDGAREQHVRDDVSVGVPSQVDSYKTKDRQPTSSSPAPRSHHSADVHPAAPDVGEYYTEGTK